MNVTIHDSNSILGSRVWFIKSTLNRKEWIDLHWEYR